MNSEWHRIDTLMVTVGTRQVGWRSPDGIVRCFGADGDRTHPKHMDRLYQELGIERGYHEDERRCLWSVRDLGHRYYEHCREWLGGDFSAVELLLDGEIIADAVARGLKQVILLATNQPETVPWTYRRADTLWLAELMKGKIAATWKDIQVEVWTLDVNASDREAIRQELEQLIFPLALTAMNRQGEEPFVLGIENKGTVPAIAEGLEICAAALVRQCLVLNINPQEPQPLYQVCGEDTVSAQKAHTYEVIPVSDYFWPLERLRVISAWERGDFREAQIWLQAHQSRHKELYQLAGYLSLPMNWEMAKLIQDPNFERGWLQSKGINLLAPSVQIQEWREQLFHLRQDEFSRAWESTFLIQLQWQRENYTAAFMQFAQTLERLLYLRCQQEDWIGKGRVQVSEKHPDPSFNNLIYAWLELESYTKNDKNWQLLTALRKRRNSTIHHAEPMTLLEVRSLWANHGFAVKLPFTSEAAMRLMWELLIKVCRPSWKIPEKTLLQSLYEWGLGVLKADGGALNP